MSHRSHSFTAQKSPADAGIRLRAKFSIAAAVVLAAAVGGRPLAAEGPSNRGTPVRLSSIGKTPRARSCTT